MEVSGTDPQEILTMLAILAIRSISDTPTDLADLGEWIKEHKITQTRTLGDLTETYYGKFLMEYFKHRNPVSFDLIFPRLSELTICDQQKEIEVSDLLVSVAILTPLIQKATEVERNNRGEGRFSGPDMGNLSQFIIWCDQKCVLTLDQVTETLIPTVAQVAKTCGMRIDRAKKRRREAKRPGALDPDIRVKYDVRQHVCRDELILSLQGPSTPIESLSESLGRWPCALRREENNEQTTLDNAVRRLWADFSKRTRSRPFLLVDSHDLCEVM